MIKPKVWAFGQYCIYNISPFSTMGSKWSYNILWSTVFSVTIEFVEIINDVIQFCVGTMFSFYLHCSMFHVQCSIWNCSWLQQTKITLNVKLSSINLENHAGQKGD